MTTHNFSTGGVVKSYMWKKFPLEENNFSVCLVNNNSNEFPKLLEFVKIIFPEKTWSFEEPSDISSNKYTMIYNFDKDLDWIRKQHIFLKYLQPIHYIISYGEYKNIPETVLTNSRMIIFDSIDDANKYLQIRHDSQLKEFDTKENFIIIDKSIVGHINIYSFSKKQIMKY